MSRRLAVLALLAAGCVGPTRPPLPDRPDAIVNALQTGELSARTRQTVRQLDLAALAKRDTTAAFERLCGLAESNPRPDLLFAASEWAYLLARSADTKEHAHDLDRLAAGYAWFYLFGPDAGEGATATPTPAADPFDPRFRLACDLYNAALTQLLADARTPAGRTALGASYRGFASESDPFGDMVFAGNAASAGTDNQYRTFGLGVSLVATPAGDTAHVLPAARLPVTALLRFSGAPAGLRRRGADAAKLQFLNPLPLGRPDTDGRAVVQTAYSTIAEEDGRPVPLESNLTAPLGEFLRHTGLREFELDGFIRTDRLKPETGVYLMEPYQPGKIPVLLVHGLLSSPVTWVPLFNDLRAEPALREKYQFWFFLYTTGTPYLESAADLRDALRATRERLDPEGRDPALSKMVILGHSMGGLVSRLTTVESGEVFWQQVSPEPVEELKASEETRAYLKRLCYFSPCPEVKRVVFLATPHHGSRISPSFVGRFGSWFVRMPQELRAAGKRLLTDNPSLRVKRVPTSVDLLDPKSPVLDVLAHRPKPDGVRYHSVIGNAPANAALRYITAPFGPGRGRSDGVVPYESAHLDGVDSEIVVQADHMHVHQVQSAVAEVKRILLLHLAE